jgi:30S ribosomal protein S31
MGKGDKKTRKGKIFSGSYGNSRRRKDDVKVDNTPKVKAEEKAKPKAKAKK